MVVEVIHLSPTRDCVELDVLVGISSPHPLVGERRFSLQTCVRAGDDVIGWGNPVDWHELASTLETDRAAWPFTCSCGVPQCAGIDDPILVGRDERIVWWDVPKPMSRRLLDYHEKPAIARYAFHRPQYDRAIRAGLLAAAGVLRADARIHVGIHDFRREELFSLAERLGASVLAVDPPAA